MQFKQKEGKRTMTVSNQIDVNLYAKQILNSSFLTSPS